MAKLTLKAPATFAGKVSIPVAGGVAVEVGFTFKHRTRQELDAYFAEQRDAPNQSTDDEVASIMKMASGWDLEEPFTAENVGVLLDNYHKAAWAIATGYLSELMQAKAGN